MGKDFSEMARQLLQETTDQVLCQLRTMVFDARHASLAVAETGSGHPAISRVALATLQNCTPILLTSALAAHTSALQADGRCSLLVGEVGKGDPMAHPRATLFCHAAPILLEEKSEMRGMFLAHHPKAKNYIDLPDFGFWQLLVERVSFNAGFGKAYAISGTEFTAKN